MVADVRRLLDADGLGRCPGARRQRPRTARASTSCRRRSPSGSRRRRRPATRLEADVTSRRRSGSQDAAATAKPRDARRSERVARSTTPSPTPPASRPSSTPSSESTRLRARRATGWPVTAWLSRLQARPAQAAAPRPRRGRQGSSPARPRTSVPAGDPGAARPGGHRGARAWPTTSPTGWPSPWAQAGAPRVGLAAARPRRPPRPGGRRHRPRRRRTPSWAGWCGSCSGC